MVSVSPPDDDELLLPPPLSSPPQAATAKAMTPIRQPQTASQRTLKRPLLIRARIWAAIVVTPRIGTQRRARPFGGSVTRGRTREFVFCVRNPRRRAARGCAA